MEDQHKKNTKMEKEITKAVLVTNADNSQEIHIHFNGMYVSNPINLDNEEMELLEGIRNTTTGRNLLCKLFNLINKIEL